MDRVRRSRGQFCVLSVASVLVISDPSFKLSQTDQNGGNFVQNVNSLLSSSLLFGPLVGRHLGGPRPFAVVEMLS